MLFNLSIFSVGDGPSRYTPVDEVMTEIERAGLHYDVTDTGTLIDGEWADVMPVIKRADIGLRERHNDGYLVLTFDD